MWEAGRLRTVTCATHIKKINGEEPRYILEAFPQIYVNKCYSTPIKDTHMKFESKSTNYIYVSFSFKFSIRQN